jgi:hypothetical protein
MPAAQAPAIRPVCSMQPERELNRDLIARCVARYVIDG